MKQFTKIRFFRLIKENNNNLSLLEDEYEKFACHLFAENMGTNKETYHNALVYTRAELANLLMMASGKKCGNLYPQSC